MNAKIEDPKIKDQDREQLQSFIVNLVGNINIISGDFYRLGEVSFFLLHSPDNKEYRDLFFGFSSRHGFDKELLDKWIKNLPMKDPQSNLEDIINIVKGRLVTIQNQTRLTS